MKAYLDLVNKILTEGEEKENRTGIDSLIIPGAIFEHNMIDGFPLLSTKKMAHKAIRVELEGFIKGITDKKWYQDRKCKIWDEWCNPIKVPYGHDKATQDKMKKERDLGPIYGFQWRHFGANYKNYDSNYDDQGVDQLNNIVKILKTNSNDRRMIVSAWNPTQLNQMALPPCHYSFQVTTSGNNLNLFWNQRSIDAMLGLPFNIASYAIMLKLLAKESGFSEGKLVGFLGDLHIYENQIKGAEEQLSRDPFSLPHAEIQSNSIFNWNHDDIKIQNYQYHPPIKFPIAI